MAVSETTQSALASWVPPPILVGLVCALFGLVVFFAIMLLNRGFVPVKLFSASVGGIHEKVNNANNATGERLKAIETELEILKREIYILRGIK